MVSISVAKVGAFYCLSEVSELMYIKNSLVCDVVRWRSHWHIAVIPAVLEVTIDESVKLKN